MFLENYSSNKQDLKEIKEMILSLDDKLSKIHSAQSYIEQANINNVTIRSPSKKSIPSPEIDHDGNFSSPERDHKNYNNPFNLNIFIKDNRNIILQPRVTDGMVLSMNENDMDYEMIDYQAQINDAFEPKINTSINNSDTLGMTQIEKFKRLCDSEKYVVNINLGSQLQKFNTSSSMSIEDNNVFDLNK
jgi:hypothetical protein